MLAPIFLQDLSRSLYSHFCEETGRPLQILGVDIDQNLVQIAEKKYTTDVSLELFVHPPNPL
jgi:hypothetical protein